jgi:hypothetical protein
MEHVKLIGLKKAAGDTRRNTSKYQLWMQICLDCDTGVLETHLHADSNSWVQYHDPSWITIANTDEPMSMKDIQEQADICVFERKHLKEIYGLRDEA